MKPVSLVCALAVLTASPCLADYSPPPLFDMVGSSDLVLVGTVAAVGADRFVLNVETVVAGELKAKTIAVRRFVDWTCAQRWAPYEEKQRVLLCLTAAKGELATIRSAGGEGEMPVVDGVVYYRGYPVTTVRPASPHVVGEKTLHSQQLGLEDFVAAIQGYRRCFRLELNRVPYPQLKSAKETATKAAVDAYMASSPVAAFLVKSTRSSPRFKASAAPTLSDEELYGVFRTGRALTDLTSVHAALSTSALTLRAYAATYLGKHGRAESVPFLIAALSDPSGHVGANYKDPGMAHTRHRAKLALTELTGEAFGFQWAAPQETRQVAIGKWKEWLEERDAVIEVALGSPEAEGIDRSQYSVYRVHMNRQKTEWSVSFTRSPPRPGAPVVVVDRKTHKVRRLRGR